MNKESKPNIRHEYPPTKELWSVLGVALGGGVFWIIANFVRNISLGMLNDPVVGCTSVGCPPGLVNLASLILYLIAILLWGFAYLGLLSFVRRPIAIALMVIGSFWLLAAIAGLILGYDSQTVGAGLISGPIILLSGLFSYKSTG